MLRAGEDYQQIGIKFGLTAEEIRTKHLLLRKQFQTLFELKQLDDSAIDWVFYDEMDKLNEEEEQFNGIMETSPAPPAKIIRILNTDHSSQRHQVLQPSSPMPLKVKIIPRKSQIILNDQKKRKAEHVTEHITENDEEVKRSSKDWQSADIYHLLFKINLNKDVCTDDEKRIDFLSNLMETFNTDAYDIYDQYKLLLDQYKEHKQNQLASDGHYQVDWTYFSIMDSVYKDQSLEEIEDEFAVYIEAYENAQRAAFEAAQKEQLEQDLRNRRRAKRAQQHAYKFRDENADNKDEAIQTISQKSLNEMEADEQKEAILSGLKEALKIIKGRSDEFELFGEFLAKEMKKLPTNEMRQGLKARILRNIIEVSSNRL